MNDAERELITLFRACRRGHDRSARLLYARLAPTLTRYALAILRDPSLADDAVQTAFLRMMRVPMRRIRAVRDPAPYLAAVVRREAISILRARRREDARAHRASQLRQHDASPHATDPELLAALRQLPRPMREVITLRYAAGFSFEQIALALSANRNTVAWRHKRALELLRDQLSHPEFTHA